MENYKTLKSAGKVSVSKDGDTLQTVKKVYDTDTGAESSTTEVCSLSKIKAEIDSCKMYITNMQAKQADLEQLEKDLKAL